MTKKSNIVMILVALGLMMFHAAGAGRAVSPWGYGLFLAGLCVSMVAFGYSVKALRPTGPSEVAAVETERPTCAEKCGWMLCDHFLYVQASVRQISQEQGFYYEDRAKRQADLKFIMSRIDELNRLEAERKQFSAVTVRWLEPDEIPPAGFRGGRYG